MTTPVAKDPSDPAAMGASRGELQARFCAAMVRYRSDASGATAIEYALISGLIFLAIAAALTNYATNVNGMYGVIKNAIAKN